MQCVEFDARLADVLDGMMSGAELEDFKAHAAACMDCGPLFTRAQAGLQALKSLAEVEPPVNLFHNIIARTSASDTAPGASPPLRPAIAQTDAHRRICSTPNRTSALRIDVTSRCTAAPAELAERSTR